jgi:hypothetical protein
LLVGVAVTTLAGVCRKYSCLALLVLVLVLLLVFAATILALLCW